MLKNLGNPGSVVAQGPRLPGVVGVVFQLSSMGGARIFTGTALSSNCCHCHWHCHCACHGRLRVSIHFIPNFVLGLS